MSKYEPLWDWVGKQTAKNLTLTFAEIQQILGFPIDHSFLNYKKELLAYGYQVGKISMKSQTVSFKKHRICVIDTKRIALVTSRFFYDTASFAMVDAGEMP